MTAQAHVLPDGRLHLHYGSMDLIVQAWGEPQAVQAGYGRAAARFAGLLDELADELPALRSAGGDRLAGPVARAMGRAVAPYRPQFITPMAAVAGAVADEVVAALAGLGIARAYANNGGDIALVLGPGERLTAAIAVRPGLPDRVCIQAADPVRGIATSGWRGRSFSLGIADAVTVLARTAAQADAGATMIANAVNLPDHPGVTRRPACELKSDSDLQSRLVTVAVGRLSASDRTRALRAGRIAAHAAQARGLIDAAALFLQGEVQTVLPRPSRSSPFQLHLPLAGSVKCPDDADVMEDCRA